MSINPVSDIVLDVARAADPVKSRAAAEKLSHGEAISQASTSGFDHVLANATTRLPTSLQSFDGAGTKSSEMLPRMDARTKPYKGLEQLVLKNLVQCMIPKESGAFFGAGTAGDIWRSLLADQLAAQAGETVDLGIAHRPMASPNSIASPAQVHQRADAIMPGGRPLDGQS